MPLLFDLMHAPAEPPEGAHALIWDLSIKLRDDHADVDWEGRCATCGDVAPCRFALAALKGLLMAMDYPQ